MKENKDSLSLTMLVFAALVSCLIYTSAVSFEKQQVRIAAKPYTRDSLNVYRVDNADSPNFADDMADN